MDVQHECLPRVKDDVETHAGLFYYKVATFHSYIFLADVADLLIFAQDSLYDLPISDFLFLLF